MEFEPSNAHAFRYEKKVEGNVVQLDLLADFPRTDYDEPVRRIQGLQSSLDLCLVDGAEDLAGHVEVVRISWLDGDKTETCDITIPIKWASSCSRPKFAAIVRLLWTPTTFITILDSQKSRT